MSEDRLRSSDLERPFRGVRRRTPAGTGAADVAASSASAHASPAQAWAERQRAAAMAYATVMTDSQFFAGLTAAVIWRLPVPAPAGLRRHRGADVRELGDPDHPVNRIEVGVLAPHNAPRRNRVRGVQMQPRLAGIRERDGLRVLDPPSVWATLGPRLERPDRVALGDAIIRRPRIGGDLGPPPRMAFATFEELVAVSEVKGRVGRGELLSTLPLLRQGMASAPESHLRLAIADAGLPEPVCDYDVRDALGCYLGTTEIAYPQFRVVIEYEGDHHRTEAWQWNRDLDKYADYERAGWKVIRVTAEKLYRRRAVLLAEIREALLQRGWRP
ncbi:MAG: hypothetical protein QM606_01935 [Leucobacter sp.]